MSEEIFDIVDENDIVIGTAPRRKCHGDPSLIHRTAHVVIVHPDGKRILLQRRTMSKDIQPGKWDTAVGGHLDHGEDYETAARREMNEELGLPPDLPLRHLFDSQIRNSAESENVRVFAAVSAGPFRFQKSEIDEIRFFRAEDLERQKADFTPNLVQELKKLHEEHFFFEKGIAKTAKMCYNVFILLHLEKCKDFQKKDFRLCFVHCFF